MGFWDSIVSGVEDAASWVGHNSDSILNVATTVAKAAGFLELNAAPFDEDDNAFIGIVTNMNKAATKLHEIATDMAPRPVSVTGDTVEGPFDLTGVWPEPAVVEEGEAPAAICSDVAKFLALNDLPTALSSGRNTVDIAQTLAAQLVAPAAKMAKAADPFIGPPALSFDASKHGIKITGQHVYYKVPLGDQGGTNAWHSHTLLWVQKTPGFQKKWADEKKKMCVKAADSVDPGTPYNIATVKATWQDNAGVPQIMAKAVQAALESSNPKLTKEPGHLGCAWVYTYQFKTATGVGPAAVLQVFSNAINNNLPSGRLVAKPVTEITKYSTVVP